MGRASRTKRGGQSAGSPDGSRGSSQGPTVHTLQVSVSGPGRVTLKINGDKVSTDCVGTHQIPHGARVELSGAGRSTRTDAWQSWEGGPPTRGNTVLFYMQSDMDLRGTAVEKDKLDRADKANKYTDSKWVDPLGGRRPDQEELAERMAEALLQEQGLDGSLAEALREAGFRPEALPQDIRDALNPEALELLQALRPAIVNNIPDHIQDPQEALLWLRADRSLILDPETSVPGMTEAGQFLSDAIDRGDKIAVFVDFDVDGITSGEILREAFGVHGAEVEMGYADLENGFGLSEDFVRHAHADGCKVIVTADCGSSSEDAVALAQSLGMQVVVTDHHETDGHEDNPADFHLNPDLQGTPAAGNTGAQIAWKLAAAMHEARGGIPESHYGQSLWMAGFGCRADGGDLLSGENRAFMTHGEVPAGVGELSERLRAEGANDNPSGDMSDLDATRQAINLGKRLDHIETVETEPAMSRGKNPLPQHRYAYDHESRQYEDLGPRQKDKRDGRVVSREEFSPEDVARAIGDPDPAVRAEAQEKVIRAYKYHSRLEAEARAAVESEFSAAWESDDKRLVRDPSLDTVPHVIFDDERMEGMSRPAANALQAQTKLPSVAFVPAGQDEDGNELVKFSATPYAGQTAPLGEAVSEIRDVCQEVGGHEQVFGGVCRREDVPEVMSRLNAWADRHPDLIPEVSPRSSTEPIAWVSETGIRSGEGLAAVERGRDMLAPYTENYHSYSHFGPTVSVIGTVTDFRSPPDGTNDKGQKVQAASSSPTHFAVLRLDDGTEREVKIKGRANAEALRAAQESGGQLEIALALKPTKGDAHSIRAFRPHEEVPF